MVAKIQFGPSPRDNLQVIAVGEPAEDGRSDHASVSSNEDLLGHCWEVGKGRRGSGPRGVASVGTARFLAEASVGVPGGTWPTGGLAGLADAAGCGWDAAMWTGKSFGQRGLRPLG
ncbi:hypothetical protein RB2524 [Rhodopirellula baltica SH 1]|uniref:Uncharacterized protein n=1 Tax=Rhodopirellula baltica (strain DSM 10527 / NCIMB 13988 / SH1) TaxID=243090 RepID=Q7UVM9_RHOBA|nr:hypothetical protein RB2524 [Rhodopirellula baltica SH 1]